MNDMHALRRIKSSILAVLGWSAWVGCVSIGRTAHAGEVEVLHFWTSPGEAQSVDHLKKLIAVRGHTWKDFAVVGGGGQNAMTALKQRVTEGSPPASASIKGPAIQEWASAGVLTQLDAMATLGHWDDVIHPVIQSTVKYKGHYVAVPVNVHRVNWLWSNAAVLKQARVSGTPANFDQFLSDLGKIKAAGLVPLAHGGQPWQDFLLFESVVLGVAGGGFYQKAFVQMEPAALRSPEMRKSLDTFRQLKAYTDAKSEGRDWNATTEMVIKGQAAFQFMGDWAKGEFMSAGQRAEQDFVCAPVPGTQSTFSYVVDTFTMFQLKNWEAQRAQGYLAYVLLGSEFQDQFNRRKGSIPARMDVSMEGFDTCARKSRQAFDLAAQNHMLVPSVAVDMVLTPAKQDLMRNIVSEFWRHSGVTADETMDRFVKALSATSMPTATATTPSSGQTAKRGSR